MDMLQKLDELLNRLENMTEAEHKELEGSYIQYREEEARGLYAIPFDLDIPEKLKH